MEHDVCEQTSLEVGDCYAVENVRTDRIFCLDRCSRESLIQAFSGKILPSPDESYKECQTLGMSRRDVYRVRTRAPRSNKFVTCPNGVILCLNTLGI
jgi:hypothetical protein